LLSVPGATAFGIILLWINWGGTLGYPTFDTDSRATLEWLDGALRGARSNGQVSLGTYLEAVLEEVLFEMEPEAPS
jgi:hypothetical protein